MWYNIYLVLVPGSWHRASKTFGNLQSDVSLFANGGEPLDNFRMEAGCQRKQTRQITRLELSALLFWSPGRGELLGTELIFRWLMIQSCLYNGTSIKNCKPWCFWNLPQLSTHCVAGETMCLEWAQKSLLSLAQAFPLFGWSWVESFIINQQEYITCFS